MLGVVAIGSFEPVFSADVPEIRSAIGDTRLADVPNLANILGGNSVPMSIKLKDLTPEWRAMSTNGQFEIGNFQAFINVFGGGVLATNYYTKGQTVSIGSETYIVAYSLLFLAEKVSPEMQLNLSLLNLKTIGSMSNIRAFETVSETKVLEGQLASLQVANIFNPTKPDDSKDKPVEEPAVTPEQVQPKPTIRKQIRSNRKYRRRPLRRTIRRNINRVSSNN